MSESKLYDALLALVNHKGEYRDSSATELWANAYEAIDLSRSRISWTASGLFNNKGLVRQLTKEEAVEIMGSQSIRAQHEETGRIWEGLRRDLPPRYSEILNGEDHQ
jgi:hypothetical protein